MLILCSVPGISQKRNETNGWTAYFPKKESICFCQSFESSSAWAENERRNDSMIAMVGNNLELIFSLVTNLK